MINLLANTGMALYLPEKIMYGSLSKTNKNWWTKWAWGWMIGGNEWWYYFQGAVWCFSFIRKPFFQKSMFWSYIVGNSLSFFFTFVINVMFLVGGIVDGGDWGNLYYPLIYDVLFFGFNAIVYYLLLPKMAAFYRWREQDWWKAKWDDWLQSGGVELDTDMEVEDGDELFNGM